MTLSDLGPSRGEEMRQSLGLAQHEIGRVISEHKERYIAKTTDHEFQFEIIGHLRYSAEQRSDFSAVGDWVAISPYAEDKAMIHAVLSRETTIERQAVGKTGEKQIISTNIDFAFIVQAVD